MSRIVSNTFSLVAVKDNEAVRDNLVHCSLMNKNRMTWWTMPSPDEVRFCGELEGRYMIMGYTGWEWLAKPGKMASVSQPLAMSDRNNTDLSNSALKTNTWYTLTFRSLGISRHYDDNNQPVDKGTGYMYVYIYPSVVDTATKYIVDGVEKWPAGDMSTPIPVTWTPAEHTITFKTASSFTSMPRILFRSFGEGYAGIASAANGSCLVRVAAIKLEEAREATAYKPHLTEYQPPIHATAFRRTNDNLTAAPIGGSYSSPTPTGWSDGIPEGTARLWTTKAVFLPEETAAAWSVPSPVGDTVDLDVEFSPYTGIPSTPSSGNLAPSDTMPDGNTDNWFDPTRNSDIVDWSMMVWRAERQTVNGVAGSWVISKIKGEDGTSFTAMGSAEKHYASLEAYNAATDRVTGKYYLVDATTGAVMYKYNDTTPITCADGDAYTTSDLHLWVKNGMIWADLGKIQGPQGAQGPGGMSYKLRCNAATIPVNADGIPQIESITLTADIRQGDSEIKYTESNSNYLIVANVFYNESTAPNTYTSKSQSFTINILKYFETPGKTFRKITVYLQKIGTSISLDTYSIYPSKEGGNGQNTVRLDLDNEMDSVVCNNGGWLLNDTTIQTTLRLYDGATLKAMPDAYPTLDTSSLIINGVKPTATPSDGNMTCTLTWEFGAGLGFSSDRYAVDVSILYNGTYYLATFTLNAMRNGKNGNNAVTYNLSTSETAICFKRQDDNTLSPSYVDVTCNVIKSDGGVISTPDGSSPPNKVNGASLYLYYKKSNSTSWLGLAINTGEVRINSSDDVNSVKFCLSTESSDSSVNDSNIIDIETVPVVIDGENGSNGSKGADGVSIDFFASANTIMMGDTGVEPSSVTFKATMAEGSNSPSGIVSSAYKIKVSEYVDTEITSDNTVYCNAYQNGYSWDIKNKTTLTKLVAELIYYSTTIRTLTIPVVKKGADGRSYNPVIRGIWTSGETYRWNDRQRDYVDYEISGVYYRFGVKTYDTSVTDAPSSNKDDANWEVCDKVSCLITNCIFGTNAVIGGFIATAGKFMSTENAYALRYFGSFDSVNSLLYRGTWSGGNTYSTNHLVLYNGVYYYSVISNNTSTPSSSSLSWSKCNDVWKVRINEAYPSVGQTIYLYEYDNATLKRPVVKDGSTYYTIKKMGAATATPTSSNSNWRELTDIELSFLNVGNGTETTPVVSYVPKYTLNGKNGTVMMLQADDTCWTYDDTGKQVNGIPYGKRIEIVPASKSIDVYDDNGKLALQVNGDTYETIDKAYGSGTLNPSCSGVSGSLSSSNEGSSKTALLFLTSSSGFEVENHPLNLSVTSTCNVTASEYRTTTTPNGNYGGIYAVPSNVDNLWVYRNDCRGMLMVQKLNNNGTWSNHNLLVSISTVGISGTTARYSGTTFCVLQPGTYRLVFIFSAELFGMLNTGGNQTECDYKVTYISASGNYAIETSRVFANGLAFGSATNDNFMVVRETGGIHVKASTATNHGFELSKSKGFEVKRNNYQGASLPVLFVARTTYRNETEGKIYEYLYWNEALGKPKMAWTARGVCEITLGSDYPTSEHIMPTLTSYAAPEMGVSARIKSWSGQKIIIELDSDYNSPNDYGGFYIKLEYIG